MAIRYPEAVENMNLKERTAVLKEWNDARYRRQLNIVTDDPTQPFSHLTAVPGGGDAEKNRLVPTPPILSAINSTTLPATQTNKATLPAIRGMLLSSRKCKPP
jgi:hypothetical protein